MHLIRKLLESMSCWLAILLAGAASVLKTRAALQLENVALRHQIGVLQRSMKKRSRLTKADRLLWVWLSRVWTDWRSSLVIVKPETVVAWHRKAFRMFWTWKIRHGKPGRPAVPPEVRDLICRMSRENPGWGAPRIHGELLKLGINVGETSVSKYLVRSRKPPSQTWRTFLENHLKSLVSVDFFTVPSVSGPLCVFGAGTRAAENPAFRCHGTSDCGRLSSSGRHFRGTAHRVICSAIATASLGTTS